MYIIKAADSKKEKATKQVYIRACKHSNKLFIIDVVLQEARLLYPQYKFVYKKEKKK